MDVPRNAELCRQRLDLPAQDVLADEIEPEVAAAIGEDTQGSKQRTLILDAIEARYMHEPRLFAVPPADRRLASATALDRRRAALVGHARRAARRAPQIGALAAVTCVACRSTARCKRRPTRETDPPYPDVVERDQLAAGYVDDDSAHAAERRVRRPAPRCFRPRRRAQPETVSCGVSAKLSAALATPCAAARGCESARLPTTSSRASALDASRTRAARDQPRAVGSEPAKPESRALHRTGLHRRER